jgi:RHS repeat-associated protein
MQLFEQVSTADNQRSATGYSFDGNGAPTTYAGETLSYDRESRLTFVGGPTQAAFKYRADGLRAKKETGDPLSNTKWFYYDGGNPVLETSTDGTVSAVNVFGRDGLVARKQSGSWRYYVFDAQGSVANRLDSGETLINSACYDAYGKHLSIPVLGTDPYGWNGRWGYYHDTETGLILCQNRYYDANQGRWLTRDPIGYAGGMNLYGYCEGGPIHGTDPTGLSSQATEVLGATGHGPLSLGITISQVVGGGLDDPFTKKMCRALCMEIADANGDGTIGPVERKFYTACIAACERLGAKGTRRLWCKGIESLIDHLGRHPKEGYKNVRNKQLIEALLALWNAMGCPGDIPGGGTCLVVE